MNLEKAELSPEQSSALQALALSYIKEGRGHNVTRAQGLQDELAQRRGLTPSRFCRGSGS